MSDSQGGEQVTSVFQARLRSMLVEEDDGRQNLTGNSLDNDSSNEDNVSEHGSQEYVSLDTSLFSQGVDPHMLQQSLALAQAMARSAPDGGDELRHIVGASQNPPAPPVAVQSIDSQVVRGTQRAPKMGTKRLKAGTGMTRVNPVHRPQPEITAPQTVNTQHSQRTSQSNKEGPQSHSKSNLPQRLKTSQCADRQDNAANTKAGSQAVQSAHNAHPSGKAVKAGGKSANSSHTQSH